MEKVERYIYDVSRRLPEKQREEIKKELRGLIEDMLEDRNGSEETDAERIEAVLLKLGDPAVLADSYRGKRRHLIGPENFDAYLLVLKIVIAATAFGITLSVIIGLVVNPPESLLQIFIVYFSALLGALFQGFAWVTVIFAIFEYFDVAIGREFKDEKWTTEKLPELPGKELAIKPLEPLFGILFAVIGLIIFNSADHLIGIYIVSEEVATRIIPLFNHEVFRSVLPLLNIMLAIGIIKESLKLAVGRWTQSLAWLNLLFNIVSLSLFVLFIRSEGLWNEAFFAYWIEAGVISADADLLMTWSIAINSLIIVVAFALLLDALVNLVKVYRHHSL